MFSAKSILSMLNVFDMDGIRNACETQIRIEEAERLGKKLTSKQRISALKCCMKDDNKRLDHSWLDEGKHCFCNGYMGIALNEEIPEFIAGEIGLIDMIKMIEKAKNNTTAESATAIQEMVAHQIADNKIHKKGNKYHNGDPIIIEKNCRFGSDPKLMHNSITALGGYNEVFITYGETPLSPIYIESKYGSGMVLPVRIKAIEQETED